MDMDRDEIAQGGEADPGRRRGLVLLAVALCVGLAIGGLGVRAWYEEQRRAEVRLRASLFEFNQAPDAVYVNMRLHNLGARAVTIDSIRFQPAGFHTVWNSMARPQTVRPGAWGEIDFELAWDCGREPRETATARLRIRTPGGAARWIEVGVPLGPPYVLDGLPSTHTRLCGGPRVASVDLDTLDVREASDGGLLIRVRATASMRSGRPPPEGGLRLMNLDTGLAGLHVSFAPAAGDRSVALPTEGDLRVGVDRCEHLRGAPGSLLFLRARLASESIALGSTGVRTDLAYGRALLDYIADRCG